MKRIACLIFLLVLAACTAQPARPPAEATTASQAALPNPASAFCEEQGYTLEIRTAPNGSQSGVCVFPDGSECDEWAYYRGECQHVLQGPPAASYWPTGGWQTSAPEERGMDAQKLDAMLDHIEEIGLDLNSLLVIRDGYIVSETYFDGVQASDRHELYSCTKSFAATLTGIAIHQGLIDDINTPILDFFPGREFSNSNADKQAITLEHVLTMTSGLGWVEGDPTFSQLYRSPDWVQYMLDLPVETPPGSQFYYCSGCSHLLTAAVQSAAGMDARAFAEQNLFAPLGIENAVWETDRQNIPVGGWGLQITPRDMAKLGYLYLHNGEWDGKQIVSAEWVAEATRKHADDEGDLDYGYQWWTYPALDAYTALGRYGQTIFVIPWANMVIVTTAELPNHDQIFDLIEDYIVPAVIE